MSKVWAMCGMREPNLAMKTLKSRLLMLSNILIRIIKSILLSVIGVDLAGHMKIAPHRDLLLDTSMLAQV
jgi:hypothetical protein